MSEARRFPVAKAIVGVVVLAAVVAAMRLLPIGNWIESFKHYVQGIGTLGYVLYVVAYVVCCIFIIPAFALTLGAGAIFGFALGSVIVIIGATLGASVAFLLARTVLGHRIQRFTEQHPKLAAVDKAIEREGVKLMLLVRLSGFPPFTWVNYGFGLTRISFGAYLLTTFVGIIPGTLAFTYAGAAGAAVATGSGNKIGLILTAVGAVLVSVYIARIATKAIQRAGV